MQGEKEEQKYSEGKSLSGKSRQNSEQNATNSVILFQYKTGSAAFQYIHLAEVC